MAEGIFQDRAQDEAHGHRRDVEMKFPGDVTKSAEKHQNAQVEGLAAEDPGSGEGEYQGQRQQEGFADGHNPGE